MLPALQIQTLPTTWCTFRCTTMGYPTAAAAVAVALELTSHFPLVVSVAMAVAVVVAMGTMTCWFVLVPYFVFPESIKVFFHANSSQVLSMLHELTLLENQEQQLQQRQQHRLQQKRQRHQQEEQQPYLLQSLLREKQQHYTPSDTSAAISGFHS